ncbi:MAG: DegT/DnrJ/EryC1/StrS family aminotransferase [Methanosphaera sp.]|uniref:DegT/DnrJ/EryC1/StrS family aminotransferase n=1 Tax=Methanosphaera sp. TaxID=2666342 RepID=UPI0025D72B58|nr:DegT/DnrJ/EryC1/StrS family aminotransferase [Methanosphaera sp.]MCI5867015.1 DegT/DnrJ/EryC1/StrS family aminotransferase [Methanosphaera sp.]MDD6533958.1 DegT/DnrJ/EryC1/StrS family aminotransferase [Methanosphaera sp.]MDY3956232.1 DegT/DnrJ/EryC1/StrS family aminotransferase [Methanosphaera sp.]
MINIAKPIITDEEIEAVTEVLKSGMLAQGKKVEQFQKEFAQYTQSKYGVATSSGTTALHTALVAADIGPGDEVITTPFTFAATANSVLYSGAKPVFADIDPKTFNLDAASVEEKITDKTKAILPVHLYGQPADMDAICEVAQKHDLKIIEDAAQAHGAVYKGKKIGSIGDLGCFSFYPTKNITTGEGGMVTTNNEELAEKAGMVRAHGESQRYEHEILGYNYRMTDIAASIGLTQLKHIDEFNAKRNENAEYLTQHLQEIDGVTPPYVADDVTHVFHQYTIRVAKRDEFKDFLNENGIGTGVHYPIVLYKQPYYQAQNITGNCPEAESAASEVLSIPVHPSLTQDDLDTIIDVIKQASDKIL